MGGQGEQVGVAEALSDRSGLAGGSSSRLPVVARPLLEHRRQQQVAVLDSVALLALEQPASASQPAARTPDLPMAGESHADPEGAAQGGELITRLQVDAMRALEQVAVLGLATDHVRAGGEECKVVRRERDLPVGPRERLVRVQPGFARIGLASPFELCHGIHPDDYRPPCGR